MRIDSLRATASKLELIDPSTEAQLSQSLQFIASQISNLGYACRPFSKLSLQRFRDLPREKQSSIQANVESMARFVSLYGQESRLLGSGAHQEKSQIEMALGFFGLELRDKFWEVVDGNDIIEIYNHDQIQVFRTLNFFNITGYSILDLLSAEWFELWHRSSLDFRDFMKFANDVYLGHLGPGIHAFELKEHIVKEIFDDGETPNFTERISLARFKYMCPLYRPGEKHVSGVMISSEGRVLPTGAESASLSFI